MSKPVRIGGDVAAQIEVLAGSERRPFANMVEVLLLAALSERGATDVGERRSPVVDAEAAGVVPKGAPRSVSADVAATIPGVKIMSSVCAVCPPGRSRPSCSLPAEHAGKHSWEVS